MRNRPGAQGWRGKTGSKDGSRSLPRDVPGAATGRSHSEGADLAVQGPLGGPTRRVTAAGLDRAELSPQPRGTERACAPLTRNQAGAFLGNETQESFCPNTVTLQQGGNSVHGTENVSKTAECGRGSSFSCLESRRK